MSARADFRPVSADFRPERADFKPERADFRLQGLISGLRARFQAFWGRGAGGGRRRNISKFIPAFNRILALLLPKNDTWAGAVIQEMPLKTHIISN